MSTSLSTADLTDLLRAQERELLLGNGLGGYTALSPLGAPGRRYHGLLVAALQPPVARTVLVGPPMLWARTDGDWLPLFTFEIEPDRFSPQLGAPLREVAVGVGGVTKEWALPTGRLTERHSAIPGANAVLLTFCLEAAATSGVDLLLRLTATAHDHHEALVGDLTCATSGVDERAQQGTWRISSEWPEVQVRCDGGALAVDAGAIRGLFHRHDAARVEADRSDYAVPLRWSVRLEPGESASLLVATEGGGIGRPPADLFAAMATGGGASLLAESEAHDRDLLARAQTVGDGADAAIAASSELQALVLAADDFIVRRRIPATPGPADPAAPLGWSVIAGYPWFNDWGRDTAIALRGLTLATGRPEIGATVLRSFAPWVRRGLLPNNFPDRVDEMPEYHTIDASLWYIEAARAHVAATGDRTLGAELLPTLLSIVVAYRDGTDFGIGADSDGLIVGSAAGRQLTWMDAKLDDWVVTPRRGKPIEISALWYRALRSISDWLRDSVISAGEADAARLANELDDYADRVRASFRARFIRTEVPWLADVVDGPDGDDLALRPNQFIAIGLGGDLIPAAEAQRAFAAADAQLRAPIGIRSLAPSDPAYRGDYDGDRRSRDGAYHQGLGWLWLIGPWADSAFAVHDLTSPEGRAAALSLVTEALAPYRAHLREAGLGTISENATGDAPFTPVACFAQAWSVSELLRIERRVAALRATAQESKR
ncbi:MAG: hypothetical protein RIS62_829 [Chloroflexota bacterium]